MALTGALLALSLAPLAIIHASSLVGFFAIASMYVACGFVVGPVFGGFYIGFRDSDAVMRCLLVSAGIVVTLAVLAAKDFGIDMHTSSSLRGTLDPSRRRTHRFFVARSVRARCKSSRQRRLLSGTAALFF